jgi:hypothetical protein
MSNKKRKKPVPIPQKFDIKSAFIYYCTPHPNGSLKKYSDVSKKFDVHIRTVEKWGKRNGWVEKRLQYGEKQVEAFFKQREKIAKSTDQKQFRNLDMLEHGIMNAIQMLLETQHEVIEDETLEIEQKIKLMKNLKMQSLDLRNLADSLKTAQNQKRIILGMPTEISKADIKNLNVEAPLSKEEIAEMDDFVRKNNNNDRDSEAN